MQHEANHSGGPTLGRPPASSLGDLPSGALGDLPGSRGADAPSGWVDSLLKFSTKLSSCGGSVRDEDFGKKPGSLTASGRSSSFGTVNGSSARSGGGNSNHSSQRSSRREEVANFSQQCAELVLQTALFLGRKALGNGKLIGDNDPADDYDLEDYYTGGAYTSGAQPLPPRARAVKFAAVDDGADSDGSILESDDEGDATYADPCADDPGDLRSPAVLAEYVQLSMWQRHQRIQHLSALFPIAI